MSATKVSSNELDGTIPIKRQNDTTNSSVAARIETGWGYITPGAATAGSEAVTFNTAFTTPPIVLTTFGGDSTGATTYGSGGNTSKLFAASKAVAITTTGFTAYVYTTDGVAWGAGQQAFYQWVAIGS